MVYTKNLILVCTGRDTVYAAKHGIPVLHLCLGITPTGALQRLQLPTVQARCLLGLCDPPRSLADCNADRLAADLVFEAKRTDAPGGVFADFEHDTPRGRMLLAAFDKALHEAEIPFYVPLACGRSLTHAILTTPTALSGAAFDRLHLLLQGIYGAARIAAFLQPVSQDFTLPSNCSTATVTNTERETLLGRNSGSQTFSPASCAPSISPIRTARDARTLSCSTMPPRSRPSSRNCSLRRAGRVRPASGRKATAQSVVTGAVLRPRQAEQVSGWRALDLETDPACGDNDRRQAAHTFVKHGRELFSSRPVSSRRGHTPSGPSSFVDMHQFDRLFPRRLGRFFQVSSFATGMTNTAAAAPTGRAPPAS